MSILINYYEILEKEISEKNISEKSKLILEDMVEASRFFVKRNSLLYRGRKGVNNIDGKEVPWSGSEIGMPNKEHIRSDGRVNKKKESMFYLAGSVETVLKELRAKIGEKISIATFQVNKTKRIIEFGTEGIIYNPEEGKSGISKDEMLIFSSFLIETFNREISEDNIEEKKRVYSVTQVIAECCKNTGFDGIVYQSTVMHKLPKYNVKNISKDETEIELRLLKKEYNYVFFSEDNIEQKGEAEIWQSMNA